MRLYLICDTSGSLSGAGKSFIIRTVVTAIAQWGRFEAPAIELNLCAWASEIRQISDWNAKKEYPSELLDCKGTASGNALVQFFCEKPDTKILMLTDGFWSQEDEKAIKRWKKQLPLDTLRIIKIGVDANPSLKGEGIFTVEDFFSALDNWLKGSLA